MQTTSITLVRADDWQGLYVDGKLVEQNHKITVHDLAAALGMHLKTVYADEEWLETTGKLPDDLKEVRLLGAQG